MKRTVLIGIASIIALAIGVGVVVASSSSEAPVASSTQGPDDATQANAARPLVALITQQEEAEALPEVTVPAIGGNLDRASAATFDAFALLSPGEKFEDRPLKGIVRRAELDPGAPPGRKPRGANYVSFHYDAGCGNRISDIDGATIYACDDPLEIQIWPACERNLSSYGKSLPRDELVVRGTPAALFERGRRLEIYTDDATVVIFGQDTDEVMRAAASLKSVNATARGKAETVTGQNLETPILGALKGTAECGQTLDWNN